MAMTINCEILINTLDKPISRCYNNVKEKSMTRKLGLNNKTDDREHAVPLKGMRCLKAPSTILRERPISAGLAPLYAFAAAMRLTRCTDVHEYGWNHGFKKCRPGQCIYRMSGLFYRLRQNGENALCYIFAEHLVRYAI